MEVNINVNKGPIGTSGRLGSTVFVSNEYYFDEPSALLGTFQGPDPNDGNAQIDAISRAFVYSSGVMSDLNTLIPPNSGWTLNIAYGINDNGQIAGQGSINGGTHGFVLTPSAATIASTTSLIQSFNLPPGTANSLIAKLTAAQVDTGAKSCNDLNDLIAEAQAQSGKKLTTAQATQIITAAKQIKSSQGCP